MMYRRNKQAVARQGAQGARRLRHRRNSRRNSKKRGCGWLLLLIAIIAVILFFWLRRSSEQRAVADDDAIVAVQPDRNDENRVYRRRLLRSEIPPINRNTLNFREMFNDSNYVQLSAARANGIDPTKLQRPEDCDQLVPIFSTRLYKVDTMYHSRPFLTPEAVLLVDYIGHRFQLLMQEYYPSADEYRLVITSALRTAQSERNLRRVNRNATDTSAHIYGTTFDISAQRTLHVPTDRDTVVEMCRQMLALALYELRYEGLCYVKYERGSCFHTTVRTTLYEGSKPSELRSYVNPGSPAYLLTKAPPRPKAPRRVETTKKEPAKATPAKSDNRKPVATKPRHTEKKADQKNTQQSQKVEPAPIQQHHHNLSDRERISLEQFERR